MRLREPARLATTSTAPSKAPKVQLRDVRVKLEQVDIPCPGSAWAPSRSAVTSTAALLLGGYLVLLVLSLRFRGRSLHGPWSVLLRSFLPSWHFYDRLGHRPILQLQALPARVKAPAWASWVPRAEFGFFGLLHNPQTLEQLYQQTLVEQLASELARDPLIPDQLVQGAAYRAVVSLSDMLAEVQDPQSTAFQFRILLIDPRVEKAWPADELSADDERLILLSPPMERKSRSQARNAL